MNAPAHPPSATAYRAAETAVVVTSLGDYAVVAIEGQDAPEFLHAQLSSDVRSLAAGAAQFSALHSAKGRVFANFVLFRADAGAAPRFYAIVRSDLAAELRQRLGMFVLRSKVALSTPTAVALLGVAGPKATELAPGAGPGTGMTAIRWPDGRIVVLVDRAGRDGAIHDLEARGAVLVPASIWEWLSIRAGIALIDARLSQELLPQALNWDAVGGIHFQKGCYPGQEIIARTHYLGRAKERLYAFHVDAPAPASGTRLFASAFGTQSCGVVVNAAVDADGGAVLLASLQVAAAGGDVRLGAPDGVMLARRPLPYTLPAPRTQRDRIA